MAIKYEIRAIANADGNGGSHKYVRLSQPNMMTAKQMGRDIEKSCTLTQADINGMMATLRQFLVRELSCGSGVHLPSIGYFRLSVRINKSNAKPEHTITGKDVRLKGILFRPERSLWKEINNRINFEKNSQIVQSTPIEEAELWAKVETYVKQNRHITVGELRRLCALSDYMARKWLSSFTSSGRLLKSGSRRLAIYYLP